MGSLKKKKTLSLVIGNPKTLPLQPLGIGCVFPHWINFGKGHTYLVYVYTVYIIRRTIHVIITYLVTQCRFIATLVNYHKGEMLPWRYYNRFIYVKKYQQITGIYDNSSWWSSLVIVITPKNVKCAPWHQVYSWWGRGGGTTSNSFTTCMYMYTKQ